MATRRRGSHDEGLALVSVLWTVTILSLIALSLMSSLGVSYHLAHNAIERATVETLAEAGVNRAILGLLDGRPEARWRVDGTPGTFDYAGTRLLVSIQDELGKIDLNASDGTVLKALFRSGGLDEDAAGILADRVLDWRDRSDLRRLNGAKDADYRAAGYSYGPRNGPFQTIDELKLVMGFPPELFARIAPAITVYSGRQYVDPQTAPPEVLRALPETVASANGTAAASPAAAAGAAAPTVIDSALGGRAFTIRVEIKTPEETFIREAVVRLTDDPAQPYWILAWR